jgi:hypothetical protein
LPKSSSLCPKVPEDIKFFKGFEKVYASKGGMAGERQKEF